MSKTLEVKTISSLSAFIVDIVLYSIFLVIAAKFAGKYYIVVATYLSKIFSCTYSYFVNKNIVFSRKNSSNKLTSIKYIILCMAQSTCSGLLTSGLASLTAWNPVMCKIIVDVVLFFASFHIQNKWVFNNKGREQNGNKN